MGALKKFRAVYAEKPHIYNSALLRVPDSFRERRAKKASSSPKTSWATALASRKRAWRPLTAADAKKHKKRVKADRKRVQKKFFEAHDIEAPPGEDIAENDAGLPAPAQSRAVLWSSGQNSAPGASARAAARCSRGGWSRSTAAEWPSRRSRRGPATFEEIPQPLRALSKAVVQALRPLDIDAGPYQRAAYGYRVHTAMIRLAWATESVLEKIRELPRDERRAARAAYDFLMDSEESAYRDFVQQHEKFLRWEGEDAPEQRRKRPLQFLETSGLENALWPNLYWAEAMCETAIRASDVRRQRRRSAADPAQEVGGPQPEGRRHPRAWQIQVRGQILQRAKLARFLGRGLCPRVGRGRGGAPPRGWWPSGLASVSLKRVVPGSVPPWRAPCFAWPRCGFGLPGVDFRAPAVVFHFRAKTWF